LPLSGETDARQPKISHFCPAGLGDGIATVASSARGESEIFFLVRVRVAAKR